MSDNVTEIKLNIFGRVWHLIDGFSTPYRLDRNSNGGGLILFVRKDISSNLVEAEAKPV